MKNEDVKIGMKVVPHSKSAFNDSLDLSLSWEHARLKNQKFLYVIRHDVMDDWYMLDDKYPSMDGDYFRSRDFDPYEGDQ